MKGSVTLTGPHAVDGGAALDALPSCTTISTYTGYPFDLMDSSTWKYDADSQREDIAQALSCLSRFNGHTMFYSVAEHSLRVAEWLRRQGDDVRTQRLGLWHDAAEAYMGDVPSPQKKVTYIGTTPFKKVEAELEAALFSHFDLLDARFEDRWARVKLADYAVYVMERDARPYPASSGKNAMVPTVAKISWLLRDSNLLTQAS